MKSRKRAGGPLDAVTKAMDKVADAVREAPADGSHINVARRTNVKVATNVGHDGGTTHASATQVAPIIQDGREQSEHGTDRGVERK